jgi:glycosyltransferase 2 family protein
VRKLSAPARLAVKILVSAGLLAFLFSKISISQLVALVRGLNAGYVISATLLFLASNVIGGYQWHALLKSSGVRIPFRRAIRAYFVGLFFNNFLPASIGGDAVKVYDVSKIGSNVSQVVAVTVLDRIIGIFSLCLLAAASVLALLKFRSIDTLWPYLAVFVACMVPAASFYFVKPLSRSIRWLVRLLLPPSWGARGSRILDYLGEFRYRKSLILRLMLLSVVIQAMRVLTHVLVARAIGVRIDPVIGGLFFVFVPLLSLAMIPPVTINGLGIREGLGIVLFASAGIGKTDAFAIEFLTYVVSIVVSLLGLPFFVGKRRETVEPKVGATVG